MHKKSIYLCYSNILRTLIVIIVMICVLDACGEPSEEEPVDLPIAPGNSVRLLAFNTQLLSPIFKCGIDPFCHFFSPLGEETEIAANLIVDELNNGFFDVLALSEAWDEDDAKDILVDDLESIYPHFVKYVDIFGSAQGASELPFLPNFGGEDSGLMLFSKFEFNSLPNDHYKSLDNETSNGDDSDLIAFREFEECEDHDCRAGKGALLVRLIHPDSGRIINVVNTHLQADDHMSVRAKQIKDIRAPNTLGPGPSNPPLIGKTLSAAPFNMFNWPNEEWVLIVGDLNVQGQGAVGDAVFDVAPDVTTNSGPNDNEWLNRFGILATQPNENPGHALYDAWAETTSERDIGITFSSSSKRLDYVIASRRTIDDPDGAGGPIQIPDLCVQHIWNPPEFVGLSDHDPVATDLNLTAPHCNPRLAYVPTGNDLGDIGIVDGKEARKLHRELMHPGSMQWFRLDMPGTYTIAINPENKQDGFLFEMYEATNLSNPLGGSHIVKTNSLQACEYEKFDATGLPRAECEEVEGLTVVLPKAPIYVRVFSENRHLTDNYWIAFHRHTCESRVEACELLPNSPSTFSFPMGKALNLDEETSDVDNDTDTAWFHISIEEQADSGEAQTLRFFVEHAMDSAWPGEPTMRLLNGTNLNDLTQIDGIDLPAQPTTGSNTNGRPILSIDSMTTVNEQIFLLVTRQDINDLLTVRAGWQTNLTLLGSEAVGPIAAKLICFDETNPEAGKDEILLNVNVDETGFHIRGSHDFDCNNFKKHHTWAAIEDPIGVPIRFIENVQIRLIEEDDGNPDDFSVIGTQNNLPLDIELNEENVNLRGQFDYNFEGGEYRFYYNVSKWLRD